MKSRAFVMAVAGIATTAHAQTFTQSDTNYDFVGTQSFGFESATPGSSVSTMDFSGMPATVTFPRRSPLTNEVVSGSDGFGALASEGDQFWRLRADQMVIDFGDQRLTEFGFYYSDLEWSDIKITFGNIGSYTLSDYNHGQNDFFSFQAADGDVFGFVRFEWTDDTDSVGIDNMFARAVPTPGAFAMLSTGGVLALRRRRR